MTQGDSHKEGQLTQNPLAELIREITDAGLSGALRLARDRAKFVVYFEKGEILFAVSNLRAHRLGEILVRNGIPAEKLQAHASSSSDEELAARLVKSGIITPTELQKARTNQASEVLRVALLWTEGHWSFDARVRVASDLRVPLQVDLILFECARHLPLEFVKLRVAQGAYSAVEVSNGLPLSANDSLVLSRITGGGEGVKFAQLTTNGISDENCLRSLYALAISGLVHRSGYTAALGGPVKARPRPKVVANSMGVPAAAVDHSDGDANALITRLQSADNHYEVLDVSRTASTSEIKTAYHALARRFHPDRFHGDSDLRRKLEAAFARIAQAYEVLSDEKRRDNYDNPRARAPRGEPSQKPGSTAAEPSPRGPQKAPDNRAESAFRLGTQSLERNETDAAIRYFAEAAMLEPRVARYRAHYGFALMRKPNYSRSAESELNAALALEPNNAAFRVMLAELYLQLGLRKRAESEVSRALVADPANKDARALLSKLKGK